MIRKFYFLLVIIFLFTGCKTVQQPKPVPKPEPAPVRRSVVIFNAISNPSTGYDWEVWVDYASTGRFSLNNIQKEDVYPGAMGSPQRQTVTLRSTKAGRVFVHFIYKRAWESLQGTDGQDMGRYIYTFDIAKDLTIKHLDTQRTVKTGYTEDSLPIIEPPDIRN